MLKKFLAVFMAVSMLAAILPVGAMAAEYYNDSDITSDILSIVAQETYEMSFTTYSTVTENSLSMIPSASLSNDPVAAVQRAVVYKVPLPAVPQGKILTMAEFRATSISTGSSVRPLEYAYKLPVDLPVTTLTVAQAAAYINPNSFGTGSYYLGTYMPDASCGKSNIYRNRYDIKSYINECIANGQEFFYIALTRESGAARACQHSSSTAYWKPKLYYTLADAPALKLETSSPADGAENAAYGSDISMTFDFTNEIDSAIACVNDVQKEVTVTDDFVSVKCDLTADTAYTVNITATDIYNQQLTKTIHFKTSRDMSTPTLSVNSSYTIKDGDAYINTTSDSVSPQISLANNGAVFYKLELPSVLSSQYLSVYTLCIGLDSCDDANSIKAYALASDMGSYDNLYIIDDADLAENAGKINVSDILNDHDANSAGMVTVDGDNLIIELTALANQRIKSGSVDMTIALTSDSAKAQYCMDNAQINAVIENDPKFRLYDAQTEVYGCELLSAQFGIYTDLSGEYVAILDDGGNEVDSAAFAYNGFTNKIELCQKVLLEENASYDIVIKQGAADSFSNTASENIIVTSFVTEKYVPLSEEGRAQLWRDLVASSDAKFIQNKWSLCVQCFDFKTDALSSVSDYIDVLAQRIASHPDRATYAANYPEYNKSNAASLCAFYDNIAVELITEIKLLKEISSVSHMNQISKIITSDGNAALLGITEHVASYKSLYSTDSVDTAIMGGTYREAKDFRAVFVPALNLALENNHKPSTDVVLGDKKRPSSSSSFAGSTVIGNLTPQDTQTHAENKITFSDIGGYDWAKAQIEYLCSKGIVSGRGDGEFAPADKITRAEFITIIVNALGIKNSSAQCSFDDVSQGDWFHSYVASGVENGIIMGSGASFMPNAQITRQDMAVIAARACAKLGKPLEGNATFTDADMISDYAKAAVSALAGSGVIAGFPDGSFAPGENLTRAQAAVVIYNIISKIM